MTGKADFTEEEWERLREGPATAGTIVLLASGSGSFRETWALAKTFAEARQQHGDSVSGQERDAIAKITAALTSPA